MLHPRAHARTGLQTKTELNGTLVTVTACGVRISVSSDGVGQSPPLVFSVKPECTR